MSFFGIGTFELFTILIIALLIFGPGRLPELMGDAGRMLRDFRRYSRELTGDFQDSVREVRDTYEELETDMRQTARDIKRDTNEIARSVNETAAEATRFDADDRSAARRRQSAAARRRSAPPRARDSQPLDQADVPEAPVGAEDRVQSESPAPPPTPSRPARRASKPKAEPASVPDDLLSVDDDVDDLLGGGLTADGESAEPDADQDPKPSS